MSWAGMDGLDGVWAIKRDYDHAALGRVMLSLHHDQSRGLAASVWSS